MILGERNCQETESAILALFLAYVVIQWAPKDFEQSVIYVLPLHLIAEKLPVMDNILSENRGGPGFSDSVVSGSLA